MSKKENNESVRMIDLSAIKVMSIDGSVNEMDWSKHIASIVYQKTDNLAVVSACLELFKTGKCEWSEEVANELKNTAMQLARVTGDGQLESVGIIVKKAIVDAIGD